MSSHTERIAHNVHERTVAPTAFSAPSGGIDLYRTVVIGSLLRQRIIYGTTIGRDRWHAFIPWSIDSSGHTIGTSPSSLCISFDDINVVGFQSRYAAIIQTVVFASARCEIESRSIGCIGRAEVAPCRIPLGSSPYPVTCRIFLLLAGKQTPLQTDSCKITFRISFQISTEECLGFLIVTSLLIGLCQTEQYHRIRIPVASGIQIATQSFGLSAGGTIVFTGSESRISFHLHLLSSGTPV